MRPRWLVVAACAAGLCVTSWPGPGPLALPASAAARVTATGAGDTAGVAAGGTAGVAAGSGPGLPGPAPDCPAQVGTAAPASTPWAQQVLGFPAVWDLTRGGGVTVAVVDSGVDANPQFGDRVMLGPDLAGADPGDPGAAADADCVGHGTSVAGLIAAAPMADISFTGVAPAATILSIKISDSDAFAGNVTPVAVRDAVELGANVINLSLATTADTAALRSAVDFALSRDVVVVAAAGNDGQGGTGPFYPAAYPGVLSVGAVQPDGSLASFSDTRTPVSVTAPGVNITSAYPGTFPDAYDPDDNGTSFAAAFVSGVVALVRSYHPGLDEAQVVARIEATADGPAGPGTGHGLVNPVQAVTAVLPAAQLSSASGSAPSGHPAHVAITRAAPPDRYARIVSLTVSAGSFGIMIVLLAAATLTSAARRPGPGEADRGQLPRRDGGGGPRS